MNLILNSDSYKPSHYLQYPPDTEALYHYIESRGGVYGKTLFFGLQGILQQEMKPVRMFQIEEAELIITRHGLPFNRAGWEHIYELGYIPVRIRAMPEGSVVDTHTPLVTVESTDPSVPWIASYIEDILLRVWYMTTVATQSYYMKQVIKGYMEKSCDNLDGLPFKLHDFGARGTTCPQQAARGGTAHLVNFLGTDTMLALEYARDYYGCEMAGFSIPAAEHSTVTAWGREHEGEAYEHIVRTFAKAGKLVAVVSDSYDLHAAINDHWGSAAMRKIIVESGGTVVVRPDSGHPPQIVLETLELLANRYGFDYNKHGFKVLKNVRVIQGDGINREMIDNICRTITDEMFSVDNVAFGCGGQLLQNVNRDTQRFAMKLSAIKRSGVWHGVKKDPATDPHKASKAGRVGSELPIVWENGRLLVFDTLDQIRARVR